MIATTTTAALYLVAGLGLLLPQAAAQCFNLDGSQVTEPDFVPCNPTAGAVSMCCALNRRGNNARTEVCTANGLCLSSGLDAQNVRRDLFIRESCTRRDWVGCLRDVCPRSASGDTLMTACAPTNQTTQWCCGDNNQACCSAWPNHPDAASVPLVFNAAQNAAAAPSVSLGASGFRTIVPPSPATQGPEPTATAVFTSPAGFATDAAGAVPTDGADSGLGGGDPGAAGQDATPLPTTGVGAGALSTQAIAGIAAGVVVVVVVMVTVGCFMAENWYKKRNRLVQNERRGSLKRKIRMGYDRDSPERAAQIG